MLKRNRITSAVAIATSAILILNILGCATIIDGSTQDVAVRSTPASAQVFDNGQLLGQTPINVTLDRGRTHNIQLKLPGYEPATVYLSQDINPATWINAVGALFLFAPGLAGLGIDYITGAFYELTPGQVNAQLQQAGTPVRHDAEDEDAPLHIFVTLEPKEDWKLVGYIPREGEEEASASPEVD